MPRLRRVADLCSSTLSDAANMRIHGRPIAVLWKKNPLSFSFSKRSPVSGLRQANKQGKGRSSKRKGNRRCPFLFAPAAGAAVSRAPQSATPSLRFSEKLSARTGRTACAVQVPRSIGAERLPPGQGELLTQPACHSQQVRKMTFSLQIDKIFARRAQKTCALSG